LNGTGLELVATRPDEVTVISVDMVVIPETVEIFQPVVTPVLLAYIACSIPASAISKLWEAITLRVLMARDVKQSAR
jgi:hypothetical protein